jgi:hypothetical protein
MIRPYSVLFPFLLLIVACSESNEDSGLPSAMFIQLSAEQTGIAFANDLVYDEEFNVYTYRNFYNGAGVGIGDINNDNLPDLFFCGNQQDNKLYLNQGNFRFKDITEQSGVASTGVWSTGVSFADINGDGWLDIYVCKSGSVEGENRHNELFINNGPQEDGLVTFTEQAKEYGIADVGLSIHAAFFDYDRDGDLDCYLLNNSIRSVGGYDLRPGQREIRDPLGGNKLYKNEGKLFTDVSEEAGIYGSMIGFGLGVTVGDVNRDGWPDLFVSNDFFERDYLYINQQNGTFAEVLEEQMQEISLGSMGADMADLNHDGYPEIYVTEMLPEQEHRIKTTVQFESYDKFQMNLENGYYRQFPRNVLQRNNGNNTFSEIGRLAGVHATDWSWGALMADFDNDGHKDIFVANGIYKDLLNQDYIQFMGDPNTVRAILTRENAVIKQLIDSIPSEKIPNYLFRHTGNWEFENIAEDWGLATPSHSNGSAYGDLDNDGDLDLVVNNVNMPAFVYRNQADTLNDHHWLRVVLQGEGNNRNAVGAQLSLWSNGKLFYQEQSPQRGFQSSVDLRLLFGLGTIAELDSIVVLWPDGRVSKQQNIPTNQEVILQQAKAKERQKDVVKEDNSSVWFTEVEGKKLGLNYVHQENDFVDFDRDRLLFHMLSREGPAVAIGDVNGDRKDDIYVGGAKDQAGELFVQQPNGQFKQKPIAAFEADKISEDVDATLFDADGDGDLDLYVGSGGNEFPSTSSALADRLYINSGEGGFKRNPDALAYRFESTGTVAAADYDQDGDKDLFVGMRLRPFLYGVPVSGYLLENDGQGKFQDVTNQIAPSLKEIGMITDSKWVDIDQDEDLDLIIVGEWMSVQLFVNEQGKLVNKSDAWGLAGSEGWWNCVEVADLDQDGDYDIVAGNHGLNSRFKASPDQPVSLWVNDFDRNGTAEQIITTYNGKQAYPLVLRHDLVMQVPQLKKRFLKYANYQSKTVEDIFSPQQREGAIRLNACMLESSVFYNEGGQFRRETLPIEAQLSPVQAIAVQDMNDDEQPDLLLGGNFLGAKPEVGQYDASYGVLLINREKDWETVNSTVSGLSIKGEIKHWVALKGDRDTLWIALRNNAPLAVFKKISRKYPDIQMK